MAKEKIVLVVDSSSGYSKKEIEKMGHLFVPIKIILNGKEYSDGVDINELELIKKMNPNSNIKTAAPSPGEFEKQMKKALNDLKADKVICITLSSKLSASHVSAITASKAIDNFKDKVFVPKSFYVGPWLKYDLVKINKMIKNGTTVEEILKIIEVTNQTARGVFCPDSLIYLKNGGRISGAAALIGNALKILPIVPWEFGHMPSDKITKKRTFKKAMKQTITSLESKWDEIEDKDNYELFYMASPLIEEDIMNSYKKTINKTFGDHIKNENCSLGATLVAHVGPIFIGSGIRRK